MAGYNYETTANRIKSLIRISGKNQNELSEMLGIAPSTLSRYINSGRIPDANFIADFARLFDVSADWLLGLSQSRFQDPLSEREQLLISRYKIATKDDKLIIDTLLSRYAGKEDLPNADAQPKGD